MAEQKKVRNYAVDFWRTFATLFVTFFHFWLIHPLGFIEGTGELTVTWFTSGNLLPVFLITTGYFLAAGYESKRRRGLTQGPATGQAWYYMLGRYKGPYPAYMLGLIWGFIVMNCIYTHQPMGQIISNLFNSVYEILGLSAIGVNATAATGIGYYPYVMYAWNTPLWYISAIFVGGFILYYLLCKNKDVFVGLIAPVIVVLSLGYWGLAGEGTTLFFTQQISCTTKNLLAFGLIENSFLYGLAGMCLGIDVYYIVEWLKKFNYSDFTQHVLTIVNGGFTILIFWWMIHGNSYDEIVVLVFITVVMILTMLGKDQFTQLINRKVFGTLGEFSLYFFVAHFPTLYVMQTYIEHTNENYYTLLVVSMVINTILGFTFQVISKKLLSPFLNGAFVKRQGAQAER